MSEGIVDKQVDKNLGQLLSNQIKPHRLTEI